MNPDDTDNDGNNKVPCPICLSTTCESKEYRLMKKEMENMKCPQEEQFVKDHSTNPELERKGTYTCTNCGMVTDEKDHCYSKELERKVEEFFGKFFPDLSDKVHVEQSDWLRTALTEAYELGRKEENVEINDRFILHHKV